VTCFSGQILVLESPTIVGIGEILWDLFPTGRKLGGAPANFAYCSHLLGSRAAVASRVGNDELGREVRELLRHKGISDGFVQTDATLPTGTVHVALNANGQPEFTIAQPVAWDSLEWSDELDKLASSADAVCFGSLAQRSPQTQSTITKFLSATRSEAVRVFDVNLRQQFYSAPILKNSMMPGSIVKLSDEEWPRVKVLLGLPENDIRLFCREIIQRFNLRLVCITRGQNGSVLVDSADMNEHPGFRVQVKDAVGAGDAFTAGLVYEFLRGSSLAMMNDTANRMGAWVASCEGGMPEPPKDGLASALAGLESV
jgi:fructokinase